MGKLLACLALAFIACVSLCSAAVINVTPASNVTSIITGAQAGDEIVFAAGTYSATVRLIASILPTFQSKEFVRDPKQKVLLHDLNQIFSRFKPLI
jgi:O-acetylhomoserine/O-acetylserine sulfhydrylase-like pyridoxal-dependent enzyme